VPEPRSRSLLVRASAKDFFIIETLVKQLDTANPAADLSHRLITLTHTPPAKITPLVQQLVQQLSIQHPGDPLTVLPYGRSKGLLVVAREPLIAQVEKMIKNGLLQMMPFMKMRVTMMFLMMSLQIYSKKRKRPRV
jgi:hypothetical protein